MATVMGVSGSVHLVTSTARWLHVDDGDDDAQTGPIIMFKNLLLLDNILCGNANSKNVEQLLKKCIMGGVSLLICLIKNPDKVCLFI
jgi:hypothetical protein